MEVWSQCLSSQIHLGCLGRKPTSHSDKQCSRALSDGWDHRWTPQTREMKNILTSSCTNAPNRQRFPWTLILVWFEIYLCEVSFFSSTFANSPRAAVEEWGLKSHQDFWERLRLTLRGLTDDPWTACGADASEAAICVIRTNKIKCLASIHLSIWRHRQRHTLLTLCLKRPQILLNSMWH